MLKKEFYELQALHYASVDKESIARYQQALAMVGNLSGCAVVDVGCKKGHLRELLRERYQDVRYVGLDISETVLSTIAEPGEEFRHCDVMEGIPYADGSFDVAFCLELIEHVENPTFLVSELKRVVKPDGIIALSAPNPYYYEEVIANIFGRYDSAGHIACFTPRTMASLLSFLGLEIQKYRGTWIRLPYWPFKPVRVGRYFLIPCSLTLLACSILYFVRRVDNSCLGSGG